MSTATAEPEILEIPDVPDDFELIHGHLVECPPMSAVAVVIANRISQALTLCPATRELGQSLVEQYFWVPTEDDPKKVRRPDMAFLTFNTWPLDAPLPKQGNPMPYVPELAVEVISPSDHSEDHRTKRRDYFRAGVQSVWIVYPEDREIYCYREGIRTPRVFGDGDTLTDPELPGFALPIDGLFPPVAMDV